MQFSPHTTHKEIIPDNFSDENGDVIDGMETERTVRPIPLPIDPSVGMPFNSDSLTLDNKSAKQAYENAQLAYSRLSPTEKMQTSVSALAVKEAMRMKAELAKRKVKPRKIKVEAPPPKPAKKKKVVTVAKTAKPKPVPAPAPAPATKPKPKTSRLTMNVNSDVSLAADFDCLGIDGLSSKARTADVQAIVRWVDGNTPVEEILDAHWVIVNADARERVIEADVIIDTRDPTLSPLPNISFSDNSTMSVELVVDDANLRFEAVRGYFKTQFGIFTILKFLATGV